VRLDDVDVTSSPARRDGVLVISPACPRLTIAKWSSGRPSEPVKWKKRRFLLERVQHRARRS
jgi:hypothetical protein